MCEIQAEEGYGAAREQRRGGIPEDFQPADAGDNQADDTRERDRVRADVEDIGPNNEDGRRQRWTEGKRKTAEEADQDPGS